MLPELGFDNLAIIEEQYEKYIQNFKNVDSSWDRLFQNLDPSPSTSIKNIKPTQSKLLTTTLDSSSDVRVYHLIQAYRQYGHLSAKINPIQVDPVVEPRELQLETLGFSEEDLPKIFFTYGILVEKTASLHQIILTLQEIYCKNIGIEYMALGNPELETWIQHKIEPNRLKVELTIDQKQILLHDLNKSELLESFLHTKYVGQKRFSLEGGETLIPMLSALIDSAAQVGLKNLIIGMAHRGRLNVLCNIMNKSYSHIFREFDEASIPNANEGSGDVKYHKGFTAEVQTKHGKTVCVELLPNASHLESVDPIVEGKVFALQKINNDDRQNQVIPILIHGDAAVAGQGIVYETLQLSKLEGYSTGGTLHFVINNQIGFTTLPKDARSTYYCTDIAKAFGAPVFHVNAENPEECVYVTHLAVELRQKFHCDIFIDLNCYRKYGHNESDEPAFTQPLEYQWIRKRKPIREIYRDELVHQSYLEKSMVEQMEIEFKTSLQKALTEMKGIPNSETENFPINEHRTEEDVEIITTSVNKSNLQDIARRIAVLPPDFTIHSKLLHLTKERLGMVLEEAKPIDWGMGETLAYGSLLWEGVSIRLSGQDSCRGTFSHRHAILMDQVHEKAYYPLKNLKANQGQFDIFNSPLSELAVLGFELGYSFGNPKALVIWEAQFGDFVNGAQTIIDQYLVSGEEKWMQKSNLVLYLPHGYEGQGPDHSSGRMERFLQLAGKNNIRVVNPTLPAQLFHLLRLQALNPIRKPLIIFTPKGLLRHSECVSSLVDLTSGGFQPVLDDFTQPKKIKKLVFCSGRIYYDLHEMRIKKQGDNLAIVRIEQLYPLHKDFIKNLIEKYQGFIEIIWLQEEPSNMGAWQFIRGEFASFIPKTIPFNYIGRPASATTAVGSHALHKKELAKILTTLFDK